MMREPENGWKRVRVQALPEGGKVRLLCMVVDGVRVFREEHYAPAAGGAHTLQHERYYTTDAERAHRSMEAALAACTEPVEANLP